MPPWHLDKDVMTPLFSGYDAILKEKDDVLKRQKQNLETMGESLSRLLGAYSDPFVGR